MVITIKEDKRWFPSDHLIILNVVKIIVIMHHCNYCNFSGESPVFYTDCS